MGAQLSPGTQEEDQPSPGTQEEAQLSPGTQEEDQLSSGTEEGDQLSPGTEEGDQITSGTDEGLYKGATFSTMVSHQVLHHEDPIQGEMFSTMVSHQVLHHGDPYRGEEGISQDWYKDPKQEYGDHIGEHSLLTGGSRAGNPTFLLRVFVPVL